MHLSGYIAVAPYNQNWYLAMWRVANNMEHDLHCWETIRDRQDSTLYIREFATDRVAALRNDVNRIYDALETMKRFAEEEGAINLP